MSICGLTTETIAAFSASPDTDQVLLSSCHSGRRNLSTLNKWPHSNEIQIIALGPKGNFPICRQHQAAAPRIVCRPDTESDAEQHQVGIDAWQVMLQIADKQKKGGRVKC